MTTSLPTLNQMREFLRRHYKHDRFEGRDSQWPNGVPEGGSYSDLLTGGALAGLAERGFGWIGRHESVTGEAVKYDAVSVVIGTAP